MKEVKPKKPAIYPAPGYILCIHYVEKEQTFVSVKEQDGLDQKSEVLKVGNSVIDSNNIRRDTQVTKGDIILHAYSNKEVEIGFTKFRFVHFTEVHGILAKE